MRVIAGTFRSRLLVAPRGVGTRPTSDRLRETLFNILAPRIAGAHFADLYAGSGAVGIEALSRGAVQVTFVEKAPPALAAIRSNLAALGLTNHATLEARSVAAHLKRAPSAASPPFDLAFFDPPWDAAPEYISTLSLLGSPHTPRLAPAALVIAEHSARLALPTNVGTLTQTRTLTQGDAALTFYEPAPAAEYPPPV